MSKSLNSTLMIAAKKIHKGMLNTATSSLVKMQSTCIERLKKADPKASMKLSDGFKSPYGTSLVDLYMSRAISKGHTIEKATKIGLEIFFTQKEISPKIKEICFEGGF